ncbi:MAG: 1-(5-phosphoribosyl)-5-amino-4-imidazole-carboxylate carboxylase [Candidatus Aquicultor secundus]|uniref:1-(5-phosphoribosyl)-5-amino-4-imidazole-carboxylate carboxylase n=1 Tax=Candidatus Aquicultor secundus TaxID=1973895 RepID=A0A2M7T600_9ACTN|nr:nickel pincer cofactor biosynthesis protein LarB [Candidatus Aquicultor secundus]NCO65549.1 nickel pincer cofactor biosynthesis protein LarB [Solirubrobacter sp.]OIO87939.1 MAG: 1-(5-phosphoribosyl)-5-amino-4-imidazole-carboxylate carboxylase [Candidatus Aquicultor secundus]PIU26474.1 MAG: 1-(5-phosphoribosyl)-5-amino-4-imidazole-carboxylate carboxylase [Candidatus Aquicultor secundus]PIW21921.1 MAG: 1-(5-phosphoribosyl)-5-amino-4-imidazole-carboxylate carboxylase [Candidatus Aquicultor secu
MHDNIIRQVLEQLKNGDVGVEEAYERLKHLPFTDLEFAKVDNHRAIRKGFPEVIFCQGKTPEQIRNIAQTLLDNGGTLLATRADEAAYRAVQEIEPEAIYHSQARIIIVDRRPSKMAVGNVIVISAGTADVPVAEEAAITAEVLGAKVARVFDVGVAGLHRLLAFYEKIASAKVLVVVAGMDGVLPSVVGGLASCPVIAVPTSIGYGAHFGGLAPLLTMLNSCASGVSVVNIDNGFGAGYLAAIINRIGEIGEADEIGEMGETVELGDGAND